MCSNYFLHCLNIVPNFSWVSAPAVTQEPGKPLNFVTLHKQVKVNKAAEVVKKLNSPMFSQNKQAVTFSDQARNKSLIYMD